MTRHIMVPQSTPTKLFHTQAAHLETFIAEHEEVADKEDEMEENPFADFANYVPLLRHYDVHFVQVPFCPLWLSNLRSLAFMPS